MKTTAWRVMLVDDHAIVRSGFRRLLDQYPSIEVIAEAENSEDAYRKYLQHRPDVLVLDLSMPGTGGIEILRRIRARDPEARVVVFSMHEDAILAHRALREGALGYVSKSNAPEILAQAVLEVAVGGRFLSPDMAQTLLLFKGEGGEDPFKDLSAREFEIFQQLVAGRASAEIAQALNLSSKTIANYHTAIKQKLKVSSDVELVRIALRYDTLSRRMDAF
jgi:DNA-binding NarL/FixJ family response regulator